MTTITTTNPTEIQTAAAEAANALERLLQMATDDYGLGNAVGTLDALTTPCGPLDTLSDQIGEIDGYLAGFERDDDSEHDDIDSARDWLDLVLRDLRNATSNIRGAVNCIRDLAQ